MNTNSPTPFLRPWKINKVTMGVMYMVLVSLKDFIRHHVNIPGPLTGH